MRAPYFVLAIVAAGMVGACGSSSGGSDPPPTPLRRLGHVEYRNTVRDLFPEADLPALALAPDPEVYGFENNADALAPSPLLIEQYRTAAQEVAAAAMQRRDLLVPCTPTAPGDGCARQVVEQLGGRAWRRPLAADEAERLTAFFEAQWSEHNFDVGLRLTVEAILLSPQFLYRLELTAPEPGARAVRLEPYELASRLSYFVWQSMPDAALFAAAAGGELTSAEQVGAQVRRMLDDPRARPMVIDFHRQWLGFDGVETLNKDATTYPEWNQSLRGAMQEETARFIEHVVFDGDGTLRALLTSPRSWVNAELAALYGVPAPADWALVDLDPAQRAGLLTQASFLASRAHPVHPSPVLRGVFVFDRLLCQPLPPPPPGVDTTPPPGSDEPMTNRDRYLAHEAPSCKECHERIDGIGFTMEHYDSIGRWRDLDDGFPVDATGALTGTDVDGEVDGAVALASRLADSEQVRRCYVTQWFRSAYGRGETEGDVPIIDALDAALAGDDDIRELLVAIATSEEFATRYLPAD